MDYLPLAQTPLQHHSSPTVSQEGLGIHGPLPLPWSNGSSLVQVLHRMPQICERLSTKAMPCLGDSFGSAPSYPPTLTLMSSFLPWCFLSLGGGHKNGVSFRAKHTTTTHCWYFDQFWASTLTTIHGCKKLFQGGLCVVLVGGENVPEGSLTTCLFCKYQ